MQVILKPNESLESAIKRFKKKVANSGLIKEIKSRQEYKKPSIKKKEKHKQALINLNKHQKQK